GFAPEPVGADASPSVEAPTERRSYRLTRCPLLEAAHEHPDIVCGVHLGLVRGALEVFGDHAAESELEPFSEPGACRLHLHDSTAATAETPKCGRGVEQSSAVSPSSSPPDWPCSPASTPPSLRGGAGRRRGRRAWPDAALLLLGVW